MTFATKDGDTTPKNLASTLNAANEHVLAHQPEHGQLATLNIAADTVVKASRGRSFKIAVLVAGSAPGGLHDCATTGVANAANQIFVIPNTVGIYDVNWPHATGIVIKRGTGQTLAISYS